EDPIPSRFLNCGVSLSLAILETTNALGQTLNCVPRLIVLAAESEQATVRLLVIGDQRVVPLGRSTKSGDNRRGLGVQRCEVFPLATERVRQMHLSRLSLLQRYQDGR